MRLHAVARLDVCQAIRRSRLPAARARSCATLRAVVAAAVDHEAPATARSQRRRATSPRDSTSLRCAARSGTATGVAARPSSSRPLRCYGPFCRPRSAVRPSAVTPGESRGPATEPFATPRRARSAWGTAHSARPGRIGDAVRNEPAVDTDGTPLPRRRSTGVRRERAVRRSLDARASCASADLATTAAARRRRCATSVLARSRAPVCRVPPRRLACCVHGAASTVGTVAASWRSPSSTLPLRVGSTSHVTPRSDIRRNALSASHGRQPPRRSATRNATASGRARRGEGRGMLADSPTTSANRHPRRLPAGVA